MNRDTNNNFDIDTEQKFQQIDRRYFPPIQIDTGAYDD